MNRDVMDLATPRILVVDDERQIHASLRLRLGKNYDIICCSEARSGLEAVAGNRFDLCFVDIHMPQMDGLRFIEAAQKQDPGLGFVVLSAFDTAENLRRAIPLQVFDFVGKPFPERHEFEARIPQWIDRTRQQRHDQSLARQAGNIDQELNSARLERDVELVASETARDALLQTAGLLTTIHAHLHSAVAMLRAKMDPATNHLLRSLDEARKTTDAAMLVAEGFFDSAYGNRDSSPALFDSGVRHAVDIALRMSSAADTNKAADFTSLDERLVIPSLTGIDFLLMMVPAIASALTLTTAGSTIRIRGEYLPRLDSATKDPQLRSYFWLNRKNAPHSQAAVLVAVTAACPPFTPAQIEAWLGNNGGPLAAITPRGLVAGLKKCHGLLGIALAPSRQFQLVLVLPG
jgi:DNA-binding response OmpR family regulator